MSISDIRKSMGTNNRDILKIDKKFESEEIKEQLEILKAIESEEEVNPFNETYVPNKNPKVPVKMPYVPSIQEEAKEVSSYYYDEEEQEIEVEVEV